MFLFPLTLKNKDQSSLQSLSLDLSHCEITYVYAHVCTHKWMHTLRFSQRDKNTENINRKLKPNPATDKEMQIEIVMAHRPFGEVE